MSYDVATLRARIPALATGAAFFDGPGGSQTPVEVADAIAEALTAPLANRGALTEAARNAEAIVLDARSAMADLLGVTPTEVVFGRSMTQLSYDLSRLLARDWRPGDEVVVTRLDHDANLRPWLQAAEAVGARGRIADFDPASGELTVDHVAAAMGDRTRVVAVTGASNLIGTRPDIPAIAALAHAHGALCVCDAVHLAAHATVDLAALGADVVLCSPYKFLGPHLGVMSARAELLAEWHPDKLAPATDAVPERFELGTLPYELLAGTTAAVDVLASVGGEGDDGDRGGRSDGDGRADAHRGGEGHVSGRPERLRRAFTAIEAHEDALRDRLEVGLAALPGVTNHARASHRTPTLLLTFADRSAADVATGLADRGINAPTGSFYALEASRYLGLGDTGGLRVGLAPYTSDEDVDRLLAGLAELVAG